MFLPAKANHQLIGACHHNSLQKRPLFVIAFILKCYCDMILPTKSFNLDLKTKHYSTYDKIHTNFDFSQTNKVTRKLWTSANFYPS